MSVINKVLRDLDERQSPSNRPAGDPLRRFTVGVETSAPPRRQAPPRSRRGMWWVLLLLVVAAGGVLGWRYLGVPVVMPSDAPLTLQLKDDDVLNLPASVAAVPAAPVESPVAVAAAIAPPPPVVTESPATPVSPAPTEPVTEPKTTARAVAPQAAPVPAPLSVATPKPQPAPTPAVQPKPVTPQAAGASASNSAAVAASPPAQRQQQAARDALAQAQTLWNTGAQDTAVSTLQSAVAVAERQDSAGMLVPLVRELARMELDSGHPAAVLDLLVRLEPQLKTQPDLWAVRANAAQRLGRHQDSVLAYGVALQSRPAEARWLLGMAVSLAAMGQTTQAGAMVEKARASGPITPEVALYLRQQGVSMPDGK
jgi:MSHA biogenesis protein MshN